MEQNDERRFNLEAGEFVLKGVFKSIIFIVINLDKYKYLYIVPKIKIFKKHKRQLAIQLK